MSLSPASSVSGGGGGLFDAYAYLREEQAQNTAGGTPANAGTVGTRTLNTEVADPDGIVSLAANQFTLQAGSYWIEARAPFYQTGRTVLILRNVTDAANIITGPSCFATDSANDEAPAFVSGRVVLAAAKALSLQYIVGSTSGLTRGLGVELNYAGITEVYAEVMIYRETA